MELEALQRSHTAHNIWRLNGQVPQTVMTGQIANNSQLFEFEWHQCGPSFDTGPAMTAKILKPNGNT